MTDSKNVVEDCNMENFPFNLLFYCEGCKTHHGIDTNKWKFNEDYINPTISPSILVNASRKEYRCHSYVKNGNIQYLGDCFHNLKGTTIPLTAINDTPWTDINCV